MTCKYCTDNTEAILMSTARHGMEMQTCRVHVVDAIHDLMKHDGADGITVEAVEVTYERYSGEPKLTVIRERNRFDLWLKEKF